MIDPAKILISIPIGLRNPLIDCYRGIASNYSENRWEPSELNGGKFCEVIYTILHGYISGSFAAKPSKPKNMPQACQELETKYPPNPTRVGDRSVRILIPRAIPYLYEIRNNRGVGHVGGDVDPNFLDATAVYNTASWMLAEVIRVFHNVSTDEAQTFVDALIQRKHPLIWTVGDKRRILDTSMKKSDQVLLHLHVVADWVKATDLHEWIEYSTLPNLRRDILSKFHKDRLLEFDKINDLVKISPLGIKEVEERIFITK
jgi:hypothetical protein